MDTEGFFPLDDTQRMWRRPGAMSGVAATTALVAILVAGWAAMTQLTVPANTLQLDPDERVVTWVLPGAPEWQSGIRPGQRLVRLDPGARPEDWVAETTDGSATYRTSASARGHAVREVAGLGIAALVLGLLALLVIPVAPVVSMGLAATGAALASVPLSRVGDYPWSLLATVVLGLAVAWLVILAPQRLRPVVAGGGVLLAVGWLASRHVAPAAFDVLEPMRSASLVAAVAAGWLAVTPWRRLVDGPRAAFPNRLDVALALSAVGVSAAVLLAGVAPWLVLLVAAIAVVSYPRARGHLVAFVDRLFVAGERERAAVDAAELERARLARDLHDVPLQELSGAITRLELEADPKAEAATLRAVAARLREVATGLHSPVLQDLGLAAALADLGDMDRDGPRRRPRIEVEVDDLAGNARPPAEVEVAAYRIVQQATTNAVAHSGSDAITIRGCVSSDSVEVEVVDRGPGIDPEVARRALRAGHVGLDSMRDRAAAVGGRLVIASDEGGVRVAFSWGRRR